MKYLFIVILYISALCCYADSNSDKLLLQLSSKLNKLETYKATFNVIVDGDDIGVGEYLVDGDKFYIEILEKQIFSDGKVQYDVNNDEREVIIDKVDSKERDVLSNPANAFNELSTLYTHTYVGEIDILNQKYDLLKLVAKDKNSAIMYVDLYLNTISGLPYKIVYKVNDSENIIEVILNKIVKNVDSDNDGKFKFTKSKYKDYEFIDFR